ncbi:efflux RND transporter permease subunit [Geomonas oryzae]|uniref:efflux RND transporter permease subunit n=1 Tax=Geomonas oryzae TaxID=2364273 RepID=UPI00100B60ED|nr:efflux RND transporter permease subunit [Geomonas oryzae]
MTSRDRGIIASLVRFSLRFRGVVIALALLTAGYGVYTLGGAKYDVFPEFAPPQVVIQTEAPGLSPEQAEALVTRPVENAVNGLTGIESLRSGTLQGLSVVTLTFDPRSDVYRDRQLVAERLSTLAGRLPQGVQAPVITPLTSSTSVVLAVGLTSATRSLMELRTIADWTVRPRLQAVPGVAKVAVFGGDVRQLQIQFRPDRLIRYGLSVEDLLAAARRATGVRGAGFIDSGNQRLILRGEGQSLTPHELARTVIVHRNGANVTIGDVAQAVEAAEPSIGAALIMGTPGVQLLVSEQYGANTREVTDAVEKALAEVRPGLSSQKVTLHGDVFRPADFIATAIGNVESALLTGAVLVALVIFLFLFNLRTAAVSCLAIPLSLLAGVAGLEHLGLSLNTMTLGGLAIAVGMVVDDAVIDVENILRRLRENRRLPEPLPAARVVYDASLEVRGAVVYATFAMALVFVPVLTMSGLAGRLFAPLGIAYILATFASLAVALTITPALCLVLLGGRELPEREPPVVRWLKKRYRSLLATLDRRPRAVVAAVALFTLAGLAPLPFLDAAFLPELKEGHFIVHMTAVPGTSLRESLRLGREVTTALLKLPFVRTVAQRAGRAEEGDDTLGTHSSEFDVDLKPMKGDEAERARGEIRAALDGFVGVNFSVNTFLTERVEETLSGFTAPVAVNIYGDDLNELDRKAREVAGILGGMPGAADVQVQSPPGTPQLTVRLRDEELSRWGFAPLDVLDAVRTAYQGVDVGETYEGNRVFDVAVILDAQTRGSVARVGDLPLQNPDGAYVRLRQLADIYETSGRYAVLHDAARRVQTVTCNVAGRDVNTFVKKARKRIARDVTFPPGSYLEFTGEAAAQSRARRELLVHSLMAGVGVVLLLSMVMGNARNLLLVMANLPFAVVGGVLAAFMTGGTLSIGSMVGFVTLFGITLRNSIMMISHYEHLVLVEGMAWGRNAAMRGASERLAPILMTALVTALGLLPMAIGASAPGREIEGPMALVILGGLVTSTTLNLLVLPTLALRYGRFQGRTSPGPQEPDRAEY